MDFLCIPPFYYAYLYIFFILNILYRFKKIFLNKYSASYLDLAIELNGGIAETKLFDKSETFKFSVVRMPYKRSNIPQKMFYATIGAEVLRICRATSNYD